MAVEPLSLFDEQDGPAVGPRLIVKSGGLKIHDFDNSSGAELLPKLTPVVRGAGAAGWRWWQDADVAVHGFTAEPVQLHATNHVLAPVILACELSYLDIAIPATGATEATLKAVLRAGARALGMDIRDLDDADGPQADLVV
jgi:hypothetical protein